MMKRYMAMGLALLLLLVLPVGCNSAPDAVPEGTAGDDGTRAPAETGEPIKVDFSSADDDMFTARDYEIGYDSGDCVRIELKGSTATADGAGVSIRGSTVTITGEETYIFSGKLDDGMIVVDAPETAKLQIVFDGVDITCATSAPLYILEADKVFLTLAQDSENVLSNGGSFAAIDENNIDAAIFSKQDLTLNGAGSLTVNSPVGHGIVSKDDLVITSGTYTVNAASHGLDANDSVRVGNANVTVYAGKDGIHAEHSDDAELGFVYLSGSTLKIEAEGDGISAGAHLQVEDGSIDILAGGGYENGSKQSSDSWGGFMGGRGGPGGMGGKGGMSSSSSSSASESSTSMKGIKSGSDMLISGGTFKIDSADDALHSNTSLVINGGTFTIASGDDAIHAEENLNVTAGTISISHSYEGLEALHIEVSGGDIDLVASDDGLNAAGGTDSSGTSGGRDGMFGGMGGPGGKGGPGGPGGMGGFGGMPSSSGGSIVISGGTLYINSSGDGMDANGTLTISGGHTTVVGPTQGDTATLDYDVSGVITGGTFIGTGASGMAQSFSDSEQGVIAVNVGRQSAGTEITLTDKNGNVVISYAPELSFAVVILSSPEIISGDTYTITVGSASGEFAAS